MKKEKRHLIPEPKISREKTVPQVREDIPNPTWRFSFAYWSQHQKYGLDCEKVSKAWIASFMDKLAELSKRPIEEARKQPDMATAWRLHRIDWRRPQVTMKKEEFYKLIPKQYHSEENYEIFQFRITKGTGRVIGFIDEAQTFQVVIVDPMHNFDLSGGKFEYKIRASEPQPTLFDLQKNQIASLKHFVQQKCQQGACTVAAQVSDVLEHPLRKRLVCLDDFDGTELQFLSVKYQENLDEMLLDAIVALYERHGPQ